MAQQDDYTDDFPPWGRRERIVPLRTYSGRIVYKRKVHHFRVEDVSRIMAKVRPPESPSDSDWLTKAIESLQRATVEMLEVLLPFLDDGSVQALYDYVFAIVEKWFVSVGLDDESVRRTARGLIIRIAELADVPVELGKER